MDRMSRSQLESWVEDINMNGKNLTDWEENLMETVNERIADNEPISENMETHVVRIHNERCK